MRPPRRSKLLATLAWCLLLATAGNLLADRWRVAHYWPREHLRPRNAFALQQAGERPEVLFVGSSNIHRGINTYLLDRLLDAATGTPVSTYSAAQPGGSAVQSALLLRDLTRSNGCPRIIVFEIAAGSLNRNGPWGDLLLRDLMRASDLPLLAADPGNSDARDAWLASSLRGWHRILDRLLYPGDDGRADRETTQRGGYWWVEPAFDAPTSGPDRATVATYLEAIVRPNWREFEIGGAPVRGLERAVAIAEACDARLVLVRMPTMLWGDDADRAVVEAPLLRFMADFQRDRDVTFLDLESDGPPLAPRQFGDPGHLNYAGAETVTRHLADVLLIPWLDTRSDPRALASPPD